MKRFSYIIWLFLSMIVFLLLPGLKTAEAATLSRDVQEGDVVEYGTYMQSSKNDNWTDIKWRVLEREGNKVLLLSDCCLEAIPFETADVTQDLDSLDTVWSDCSLRNWLNQSFYESAFSEREKDEILETRNKTDVYKVELKSEETKDKVFLLSDDEVRKYFPDRFDRQASATDRAINGDNASIFVSDLTDDTVFWWLRSVGGEHNCAKVVGAEGAVVDSGFLISRLDIGVRPAMWVNLR